MLLRFHNLPTTGGERDSNREQWSWRNILQLPLGCDMFYLKNKEVVGIQDINPILSNATVTQILKNEWTDPA